MHKRSGASRTARRHKRVQDTAGSMASAMDQAAAGMQQESPSPTSPAPLPDEPVVAPNSGTNVGDISGLATGLMARFESLEGLYQRIASAAAGGGTGEQASNTSTETASDLSLILQALETQNRLLENAKGQQSQQILWQ